MVDKVCLQCGISYRGRPPSKYCSNRCSGLSKASSLADRNRARRKYPSIEGLNKNQICYRFNEASREKSLNKDKNKRIELVLYLGGICVSCGYSDLRALVLDHKNGDGYLDRKILGTKIARYYIKNLEEAKEMLQVLCSNCNMIKSVEHDEHNRSRRLAQTLKKLHK